MLEGYIVKLIDSLKSTLNFFVLIMSLFLILVSVLLILERFKKRV